jgi:hypothetical protein
MRSWPPRAMILCDEEKSQRWKNPKKNFGERRIFLLNVIFRGAESSVEL